MVSYSCVPNMAAVIFQHNKLLLKGKGEDKAVKSCNCCVKSECPLNGNCLDRAVVYCASLNCPGIETKKYFGLCETDFKSEFNNHKHTFRNENKANATELFKYIWNCKRSNLDHQVIWDVAAKSRPQRNGAKYCNLCQSKKLAIIQSDPNTTLNKRSEILNKCGHKNKFILKYERT